MRILAPTTLSATLLATLSAIAISLSLSAPGLAADYYVDQTHPQADDANPGSEAQPWLSIQHGADVAVAGDTVFVKAGSYVERVRLATPGQADHLIRFVATPRRSVLMHGFNINGADYVHIEGFDISHSELFTEWDETQGFFVGGSHVAIIDNYIHDLPSTAITGYWHEPFPVGVHVAGNTISSIQMGIGVQGSEWLVEDNEIARLFQFGAGDCDYMRFFGTNHVIRRNFMHGTSFDEIGDAHVDCFQTFTNNDEETRNILFDGNVCHDFHQGLMASNVNGTNTSHFTFTNNIFAHGAAWGICVHDVPNITLLNNTFFDIAYHGAGFRGASTGNVVRNNIFARVSSSYWGDEGGEVTGDYNLIFEANDPSAPGANNLLGIDPQFVDADNDDLRLQEGSPAIDSGDSLAEVGTDRIGTSRPQGAGWDIGAWEYTDALPLTIVTQSLADAEREVSYTAQLTAAGGTVPYSWSIAHGSLPEGLNVDSSGAITGTPTRAGFFEFETVVADQDGDTTSRNLTITVRGEQITVPGPAADDSGCGCAVIGQRSSRGPWLALLVLGIGLQRRRSLRLVRRRG